MKWNKVKEGEERTEQNYAELNQEYFIRFHLHHWLCNNDIDVNFLFFSPIIREYAFKSSHRRS